MKLKIAFLQLLPGKTLREQYDTGKTACDKAKEMGADIALFPEMWSDGYYLPQDEKELSSLSISKESDFIAGFRELAKKLEIAIGITFLEKHDPSRSTHSFCLTAKVRRSCTIQKCISARLTLKKCCRRVRIFMQRSSTRKRAALMSVR